MATAKEKYCFCGSPYDVCKYMIQCDQCKEWFHGSCVYIKEYEANDIEKFHCPKCQLVSGPSIMKERRNWHRHNYWEEDAQEKPVQAGTAVFTRELKQRHFPPAEEDVVVVRGQQLTLPYFVQNGFEKPILIPSKDGLGLMMPPESFTVNDIMDYVGEDCPLDVIDVARQEDLKMIMKDWVTYYNSPERDKIYNVISLEFSQKRLSELVRPPSIVQKLSWVESHWPDNSSSPPSSSSSSPIKNNSTSATTTSATTLLNENETTDKKCSSRPRVMKYCLMGTEDSYTDFHIDFGGTSVWYHILQGEKIFYLIRPTSSNLTLYERWMSSANQSESFFGDQVDNCFRVVLTRGQTLFIPSGWIHAVLTSVDSLVFGGNFLCSMNIPLQIEIQQMEGRIKTPHKYKFPSFEDVHWYAAPYVAQQLRDFNDGNRRAPSYLIQGAKTLISILKNWTSEEKNAKFNPAPKGLNPLRIIKDLGREVRMADKQVSSKNRGEVKEGRRKNSLTGGGGFKLKRTGNQIGKLSNIENNVLLESKRSIDNPEVIKDNLPDSLRKSSLSSGSPSPNNDPTTTTTNDELTTTTKGLLQSSPPSSSSSSSPLSSSPNKSTSSKKTSSGGGVGERITPGRAFATTNAARRKAAAANRNNALKMRQSAAASSSSSLPFLRGSSSSSSPTTTTSPGPGGRLLEGGSQKSSSCVQRPPGAATRNSSKKESVYDFVDSDEDQLIVDEKPRGTGKRGAGPTGTNHNAAPLTPTPTHNNNAAAVGGGGGGNFKQRMIVRSEQMKTSPAIATTPDGLPIARKSAPGPPSGQLSPSSSANKQQTPGGDLKSATSSPAALLRLKLNFNGMPLPSPNELSSVPPQEHGTLLHPPEENVPLAASSKNGTLDTLLLACDFAGDPESTRISLDDDLSNSGRASPSTREAIQGMLSMSKSAFTFGNGAASAGTTTRTVQEEFSSQNNHQREREEEEEDNHLNNIGGSSLLDSRLVGLSLLASKCLLPNSSSPSNIQQRGSTTGGARTAHGLSGSISSRLTRRKTIGGGAATTRTHHRNGAPNAAAAPPPAGGGRRGEEDDFEATLKNCHQDKDYIYFDLDTTEEDQNIFKKRGGRATHDESWSPRARVNISCPKPDRPVREGVKKEAIESGLAAAAAKLADLPPPKRPYHRKRAPPQSSSSSSAAAKINKEKELAATEDYQQQQQQSSPAASSSNVVVNLKRAATESTGKSSSPPQSGASATPTSSGGGGGSSTTTSSSSSSSKKPKKGFATAKQRLGKILKIHKMLH